MKAFVSVILLAVASAKPQSYSTFTGYGHNYGYNHDSHDKHHSAPYDPKPYAPEPYSPEPLFYHQKPGPYAPAPYAPAAPYKPAAYAHPAPHHALHHVPHHAPAYGYEQPKHNCSVLDVTEIAEVCTPAFETMCENVDLAIKKIVDKEFCYTVTRTVCTESIEEIDNEICSYNYQKKSEDTTAKTVEVTFKRETNVQMVTVCQPGYGHGYQAYGHQYCKEVAQETAYNVPVVTSIDVPVTVIYPEPVKTCVNKPISLPRVSCEDLSEEKCITVPEVEDATESIEKCITKLGEPSCQKIELTLPKQVCKELTYGYAEDAHHHAKEYKEE